MSTWVGWGVNPYDRPVGGMVVPGLLPSVKPPDSILDPLSFGRTAPEGCRGSEEGEVSGLEMD